MSNERTDSNRSDVPGGDGIVDAELSRAYREAAQEHAPAELDARILAMASKRRGVDYSRTVRWLRPMAWAATIALSLAIVVELSLLPDADFATEPLPASAPVDMLDGAAAESKQETDAEAGRERTGRRQAEEASKYKRPDSAAGLASPATTEPEPADDRLYEPPVAAKSRPAPLGSVGVDSVLPDLQSDAPVARDVPRRSADSDAFTPSEATIADEAASSARVRENSDASVAATELRGLNAVGSFEAEALEEEVDAATLTCSSDAIADAETWLLCIEDLEAQGLEEEAEAQRELLKQAFPDVDLD